MTEQKVRKPHQYLTAYAAMLMVRTVRGTSTFLDKEKTDRILASFDVPESANGFSLDTLLLLFGSQDPGKFADVIPAVRSIMFCWLAANNLHPDQRKEEN